MFFFSKPCVFILFIQNYLVLCDPLDKLDPELKILVEENVQVNILVWFGSTVEALAKSNRTLRKTISNPKAIIARSVYESLNDLSQQRTGVFEMLTNTSNEILSDYEFEILWITNRIFIKEADIDIILPIANDPNVTRISQEVVFPIHQVKNIFENVTEMKLTWGLEKIRVAEAWEFVGGMENAGKGVVVGIMDTGCNVNHESVRESFVGEYGWFDPINLNKGPLDTRGHGSHVTGTILGKNGIGVAPSAKHSQCRVCNKYCTEKNFDRCAQFFICPGLADGSNEDCSKRVDVVNISFDFGQLPKYSATISALRTAGIVLVASAGNKGPNCSTISIPSASIHDVIVVGNTDLNDKRDESSSRGPSGGTVYKPDVCAPGAQIASVNYDDLPSGLCVKTGTSMAAAHVTGLVALILGIDKKLGFDKVRKLIIENTDQNLTTSGEKCGGILDSVYPNDFCGYGRINALKTLKAMKAQTKLST